MKMQNRELCQIFIVAQKTNNDANVNVLLKHLIETCNLEANMTSAVQEKLIKYFMPAFKSRFKKSFYSAETFFSSVANQKWLDGYFELV